jgi:hypothetical protein
VVGKLEGKRALGRPMRRWEVNIRMDLGEILSCGLGSSGSEYGPGAGCCEHGNEPLCSIKGGKFID